MDGPIHIAITRRVRKAHVAEFERALAELASRSSARPGARGVHCLHPLPGSGSTEYGVMRGFANAGDRDASYQTALNKEWLARIEPMVKGEPTCRPLDGLEAWFRDPRGPMHCSPGSQYGRSACLCRPFLRRCLGETSLKPSPLDLLPPGSLSSSPGSPCLCGSRSRTVGFTQNRKSPNTHEI